MKYENKMKENNEINEIMNKIWINEKWNNDVMKMKWN